MQFPPMPTSRKGLFLLLVLLLLAGTDVFLRPETLFSVARYSQEPAASPAALQKVAERLFYRTAEIRARARLVNESLKPDLVLCLHSRNTLRTGTVG